MSKHKFLIFMSLILTLVAFSWGIDRGWAQSAQSDKELRSPKSNKILKYRGGKVTPAERKAAAKRAKALGLKPGVAGMDAAKPAGFQPGGSELKGEGK